MKNVLSIVAAAALLAGCGPLNENSAAKGFLAVAKARLSGDAAAAAGAAPAPVLTRAQADAAPGQFLLVTAYGGASVAAMVPVSTNGIRATWLSADNVTVTTENGVIVATRGFPRDLMAADIRGVREAIAAGGGSAVRAHETLSDIDQISQQVLQCSIARAGGELVQILGKSFQTQRIDETCEGESVAFTNTYWLGADGAIRKSRQAVAPGTGFLVLERP